VSFLTLTVVAEVALVLGLLAWLASRRRHVARPSLDLPTRVALAGIVVVGLIVRTLWAGELATPTHHAGLMSTTSLHELATERSASELLAHWQGAMERFQGLSLVWSSAFMFPIDLMLLKATGPVLAFPALAGAFWGILSVLLAFGVGRRLAGPSVGLAFAALLAVSPMQITWSRVGGIYVGAVPHVLGAVWLAMIAVDRRNLLLALLAGAWSWMSLYDYYLARLAIPLGAWTVLSFHTRAVRLRWRGLLVTAYGLPFAIAYAVLLPADVFHTFWPAVGTGDFQSLDLWTAVTAPIEGLPARFADALRLLFVSGRESPRIWSYGLGAQYGGAVLLPVALLGALGLVRVLRHPGRYQLVLALLVVGLVPALFSYAELRRMLVFDAAWCLAAAFGVVGLGEWLSSWPISSLRVAAAGSYIVLACWSFGTVLALAARPQKEIIPMPFGMGLQSEGLTCNGCGWRARRWRDAAQDDAAVVVFDGDTRRDDMQFHLRTAGYAQLASLAAGREGAVIDFYDVVRNVRHKWTSGPTRYWQEGGLEGYLRARLESADVGRVVWVFTAPTQLERRAIARLRELGRIEYVRFPFDASDTLGLEHQKALEGWMVEVTTPRDATDDALSVIRETLAVRAVELTEPDLTLVGERTLGDRLVAVAGKLDDAGLPVWGFVLPHALDLGGHVHPVSAPAAIAPTADGFVALTSNGSTVEPVDDALVTTAPDPALAPVGNGCAALVDGGWLVVDPITGTFRGAADTSWLPSLPWTGIVAVGDQLVLASATGELVVGDPFRRRVTARWPMPVWRGRYREHGDCSTVLVGNGWYATCDYDGSRAAFFGGDGMSLGTLDLRQGIGDPLAEIEAVGAVGDFLAVGNRKRGQWGVDMLRLPWRAGTVRRAEGASTPPTP
jgi:hypothetical protein